MRIDTVFTPAEIATLPQRDLSATRCVVFDVLRATSSMVTALAHGAEAIRPVRTIEEALELKRQFPEALLGGERRGDVIDGFDLGNSPLEYRALESASVISTTTNGTVALCACAAAAEVLAAALLNLDATADYLRESGAEDLLLVCAGTFETLALEDAVAAGMLCSRFPGARLTDAAQLALTLFKAHEQDIAGALRLARNGRAMLRAGREDQLEFCAQVSVYDVVATLIGGAVRPLKVTA